MADEQGHPHTQVLVTHVNCEPITDNKSTEAVYNINLSYLFINAGQIIK